MTIDEAIAFCYEKSNNIKLKAEPQVFIQLAEWLEELKVYQQHEIICNKGYNEGYNKAIDDFAEKLKEMANNSSTKYIRLSEKETITTYGVEQIAEQLKAGGENERSI